MMELQGVRTGRQLALLMQRTFPDRDWIADMARLAGQSRDTVEWHLQEDMEPPCSILQAAESMAGNAGAASGKQAERATDASSGGDLPSGNVSPDELPFAGVPGFIGKLRKDEDER
jgi:hypothetical protein